MFTVADGNFKNALLEIAQAYFGVERPEYVHFDYGPHHAKVFRCICIFDQQMTSSIGRTKIEAEKRASELMLDKLKYTHFKKNNDGWIFLEAEKSDVLSSQALGKLDSLKHDPLFDVLGLYGDAVLRYVIAQYLYDHYAGFCEGFLTLIISETMQDETRARVAKNLKLESYVRTEVTTRTLAATLSAVVGKLSFMSEDNLVKALVLEHYQAFIDHAVSVILSNQSIAETTTAGSIKTSIHNFKNELQEYAQKSNFLMPSYQFISQEGIDHAPTFTVACVFKGITKIGAGLTKKSAEQNAAQLVLKSIYSAGVDNERLVKRSKTYTCSLESESTIDEQDLLRLKRRLCLPYFVTLVNLKRALTHASLDAEENYQRLEFLGDAILRMLIIDYLLHKYPTIMDKAFLSPLVDRLVSSETQIKIAKGLQLNQCILSSVRVTDGMLGDVLEALIASIYIDAETSALGTGFCNTAERFIIDWFKPEIIHNLSEHHLASDGIPGADNFPTLNVITMPKTTVSTNTEIRSYAAVAATAKQIPQKPKPVFWSAPKIQEDFPSLSTSVVQAKTIDVLSKSSDLTTAKQLQTSTGMVSTLNDTKGQSYASVVAKTKRPTKL